MRFRRPHHVSGAWTPDGLQLTDLETKGNAVVDRIHLDVLREAGVWTTTERLVARLPDHEPEAVTAAVEWLARNRLLLPSDRGAPEFERLLRQWDRWAPTAAAYHFGTRNVPFRDPRELGKPLLRARPQPPALKSYAEAPSVELPAFRRDDPLPAVLRRRRTCRRYEPAPMDVDALSDLCGLTWGTQCWVHFEGVQPQQFKTSPSGGARHCIEAYVAVLDVAGVPDGLYHYAPDEHALRRVHEGIERDEAKRLLAGQGYFAEASMVVFMTALWERVIWRYGHARGYRQVFIEAGHLAQSFLLLATEMGLGCFCTAAIDDAAVETALGLDGVRESVIYAVGAGPAESVEGVRQPLPAGEPECTFAPPSYHSRLGWSDERAVD